jgi:hypothetical protein
MPPDDLAEVLNRLRREAEGGLADTAGERESREREEEILRDYRLVRDICEELIASLDPRRGGSA